MQKRKQRQAAYHSRKVHAVRLSSCSGSNHEAVKVAILAFECLKTRRRFNWDLAVVLSAVPKNCSGSFTGGLRHTTVTAP